MRQIRFASIVVGFSTVLIVHTAPATEPATIDLTQWALPSVASAGNDPFGRLVKYGYALFTDTPRNIGPTVPDPAMRYAGNNLACGNCHLKGGTQPYAMPLVGIWGQFPKYRAREGAVVTLEDRINGCMERSMNGRALPLESREMRALSAYMRWLSDGVPGVQDCLGPARCVSRSPGVQPIPLVAPRSMAKYAQCATARTGSVSARMPVPAISFHLSEVQTASTMALE